MENYIGDNIHAIRTNFGLSQTKLAEIAEVSQTAVSSWECGQNVPRFGNAVRIVETLPGLKMDDIYSEVLGYARRVCSSQITNRALCSAMRLCTAPLPRALLWKCSKLTKRILCP